MPSQDSTPRHPIRVVARRTGLTAPTIRAWERRYGVVHPARSPGGQRLYTDGDLRRLDTLRELTEMGRSIGMVAALPPEAAAALLLEDRAAVADRSPRSRQDSVERWIDDAYTHILDFEDDRLEMVLWRAFMALDAATFLDGLVGPLLTRVGAGWESNELTTAQEHLASEVVDGVLAWMIDTSTAGDEGPRIVVATVQGERHGLGARLVAATAAIEACRVTYLGVDLPPTDIADAASRMEASAVALSFVLPDTLDRTAPALAELRTLLHPSVELLVGGGALEELIARGLPKGVRAVASLEELRADCRRRRSA